MSVCMVTGAAGFLGSHLADRLLREGHAVIGVDSFTPCYSQERKRQNLAAAWGHPKYWLLERDVADLTAAMCPARPEYVFHLAGQPGVRASWGQGFVEYARRNVVATEALLDALRPCTPRRFILASSSSVYGVCERYPASEAQMPRPISPYGVSKLAAENLCFAYSHEFSFSSVVLRFFTAYGPRQRPDMGLYRFLHAAGSGQPVELLGSGAEQRDYTYVEDIVDACMAAMHLDVRYEVLNIGSGNPISLKECLDTVDCITGLGSVRRHRERQPGDPDKTYADIEKARSLIGYEPKWSFPMGVQRQWDWFLTLSGSSAPAPSP